MSTVKTLAKSSVLRIIETIVSILTGFFMMPFLITHLGESDYGIWILIGSITASLYIFDLGFTEAITRFVGNSLNKKEYHRTNQVISTALLIYTLLALVVLCATFATAYFASHVVDQTENLELIQLLIIITGVTLALEFPFKAFAGIAVSKLRYDLLSISRLSVKIISVAVTVYMVLNGHGLLTIAIIGFATNQLGNWLYFLIARYLFKEMHISVRNIERALFKEILHFSKWTFLIDFSRIMKSRIDLFIIAAYLSTSVLTTYYVAVRLVEYSMQFLVTATNFTTPLFVKYNAESNQDEIIEKMNIFARLNLLLGAGSYGFFFLFGNSLIYLWMGEDFAITDAYNVLLIVLLGRLLGLVSAPAGTVLIALSKPKINSIVGIAETFLSAILIFSFVAILDMGVIGAAIGLTLPFFVTRTIVLPFFTCHALNISILNYYRPLVIPLLFTTTTLTLWNLFVAHTSIASIYSFLLYLIAYGVTFGLVILLTLNAKELTMLSSILPHKIHTPFMGLVNIKKRYLF